MSNPRILGAVLGSCIFAISACSLDYGAVQIRDEIADSIPDYRLYELEYNVVRNGRTLARLEASEAESFDRLDEQVLEEVSFVEFGVDGEVITEGRANRAVVETETDNARLEGDIVFFSAREEARVESEFFAWDEEARTVTSSAGGPVRIQTEDGSSLEGRGFSADMRYRIARFAEDVDGFVASDEDDAPRGSAAETEPDEP